MNTGVVKFFKRDAGYGFIVPDDGGPDVFFHISTIRKDVAQALDAGSIVTYETGTNDKTGKKHAEAIRLKSPD